MTMDEQPDPTDLETEADAPEGDVSPVEANSVMLVIGSNIGHARRHADRRGLPRKQAIAIGSAVPGGVAFGDQGGLAWADIAGETVLFAKPEADQARAWDDLRADLEQAGVNIETDSTN